MFFKKSHAVVLLILIFAFIAITADRRKSVVPLNIEPLPVWLIFNTQWEMSPSEVEKANHTTLWPLASDTRSYLSKDKLKEGSNYSVFEQRDVKFLGYPAEVVYLFIQNRLFSYHVRIQDDDGDALDEAVRKYLVRKYGPKYLTAEENASLKFIWHVKDQIVNYWFYRDDLKLRPKYTADFGVFYRPLGDKIEKTSLRPISNSP